MSTFQFTKQQEDWSPTETTKRELSEGLGWGPLATQWPWVLLPPWKGGTFFRAFVSTRSQWQSCFWQFFVTVFFFFFNFARSGNATIWFPLCRREGRKCLAMCRLFPPALPTPMMSYVSITFWKATHQRRKQGWGWWSLAQTAATDLGAPCLCPGFTSSLHLGVSGVSGFTCDDACLLVC